MEPLNSTSNIVRMFIEQNSVELLDNLIVLRLNQLTLMMRKRAPLHYSYFINLLYKNLQKSKTSELTLWLIRSYKYLISF